MAEEIQSTGVVLGSISLSTAFHWRFIFFDFLFALWWVWPSGFTFLFPWLDKFYLVLQVSLFGFVRVVLCLRCFPILGYRPEFVTHYGLLSPLLVSVLGLYRCFQSDSLLYLVFSLYSYWPAVFHPSIDIMPCAFHLAYIRLKFDWKAEEMEGKTAVSLLAYDHPSSSPAGLVCSFYLPLRICHNSAVSWFVSA